MSIFHSSNWFFRHLDVLSLDYRPFYIIMLTTHLSIQTNFDDIATLSTTFV